jgi:hypothetical protein
LRRELSLESRDALRVTERQVDEVTFVAMHEHVRRTPHSFELDVTETGGDDLARRLERRAERVRASGIDDQTTSSEHREGKREQDQNRGRA